MKKFLSLCLALVMVLSLAGCGAKPESAVEDFCKAMQKFDLAAMGECVDGSKEITEEDIASFNEDMPEEIMEYFVTQAKKMTYSVDKAEVGEDTATITVTFSHTDIQPIMLSVLGEYVKQALVSAFSGASEEDMEDLLYSIFAEKVASEEVTTTQTTVAFPCVKTDDGWKISEVSDDVLHILTCNIAAALKAFDFD